MNDNMLKQIEKNTRRTADYLGAFMIIFVVGAVIGFVAVIANFG